MVNWSGTKTGLKMSDKADHVQRTPTPAEVVARMVVVDWFGALSYCSFSFSIQFFTVLSLIVR